MLTTLKNDAEIQEDVLEELRWDTRVKEATVGVSVERAVVTLSGIVDSWAARVAAQDAAHRVAGVLDVANEIRVKLPGSSVRTDEDLARAAREALVWNVLVPEEHIKMTVSDGVVRLEGHVESWNQHDEADRTISNLAGVREVQNLICVEPPNVATAAVRTAIERALARHVAHVGKHVRVSVEDGTVTLSGEVPSWAERDTVEGAARGTHGVRRIDNRIHIGG